MDNQNELIIHSGGQRLVITDADFPHLHFKIKGETSIVSVGGGFASFLKEALVELSAKWEKESSDTALRFGSLENKTEV